MRATNLKSMAPSRPGAPRRPDLALLALTLAAAAAVTFAQQTFCYCPNGAPFGTLLLATTLHRCAIAAFSLTTFDV